MTTFTLSAPNRQDADSLRDFFTALADEMPKAQLDEYHTMQRHGLFGDSLNDYLFDAASKIAVVARDDKGVTGLLLADKSYKDAFENEGWIGAEHHLRLMWYGVRPDIRNTPFYDNGRTLGDQMLHVLQDKLKHQRIFKRVETLVHQHNGPAISRLVRMGFVNKGRLARHLKRAVAPANVQANYVCYHYTPSL